MADQEQPQSVRLQVAGAQSQDVGKSVARLNSKALQTLGISQGGIVEIVGKRTTAASSDLLSKWYGESEQQVSRLFRRARQVAPAIIFLDEIESLAPQRGDGLGEPAVTERVVNTLLSEMDGLEELQGIVVIGATNRPTLIDPAMLRPGRFDELIYVPVPDKEARIHILGIHTAAMPVAADVELESLADQTEGYSGADLENLVRRAGLQALRENLELREVPMRFFKDALRETRPSVTPEMEREYREIAVRLKQASPQGTRIGFQTATTGSSPNSGTA